MEDKEKNKKLDNNEMDKHKEDSTDFYQTTNQGVKINNTDDSLKAGERGPTIMEDFHFREKMTHFDHERIPERVVHARGSAAHGYFQPYESMKEYTKAGFLQDPNKKTPVFVRFSTVVGFRGSADTVRDVRGFATKFYTDEGNYDLVGNNIPVFFIQDGMKFPDLVHAIKPEPHNQMPQASAAHDNFWDFVSLMPESMHMIMWVLSHRGVPRSYNMMEGFGVHTFRFINEAGKSRFVKFHWKPKLGVHSLEWDEAQKIAGKNPDYNRKQLWDYIEAGQYPEFELGVQMIEEEEEFMFDFDILDATKLWPEELVPVKKIGKMVLNKNPDNFFAETEQVAFHPGHVVPGIDFTNDPLLQGRLFSYIDTQLTRLGGPNFAEIPINRPKCPVHNNQRDGFMRQTINKSKTNYFPNSRDNGCPMMSPETAGAYTHHMQKVDGEKVRKRSESFKDFYSQAKLFWNSMTEPEKNHIQDAFGFELGKVQSKEIRTRMVGHIKRVDVGLAQKVADKIGVNFDEATTDDFKADQNPIEETAKAAGKKSIDKSPALSISNTVKDNIKTRMIAIVLADGFDYESYHSMRNDLETKGAMVKVVAPKLGEIESADGKTAMADDTFKTTASVLFDAVYIPGGKHVEMLKNLGDVKQFVMEMYKHYKTIGASGEAIEIFKTLDLGGVTFSDGEKHEEKGVVTVKNNLIGDFISTFTNAVAQHRHYNRLKDSVPA